MNNYYVEDEIDNYSASSTKSRQNGSNKILLIAMIIFVAILIIIFVTRKQGGNTFTSYEQKLVTSAKEYVQNNNINASSAMYIDVSKLNMKLPDSCSLLSGVIYDGNDYTPYLVCNNYETTLLDNTNDKTDFKLIGNSVVFLLKGMEYYELGYECSENVTISSNKTIDEGVYDIFYILGSSNFIFSRKVIVIDNPNLSNNFPAINIGNTDDETIELGDVYYDYPVAVDTFDGDLTDKIIKISNLDVNNVGEYKIIYSVRNSLGYTTSIMKKIAVIDKTDSEVSVIISLDNDNLTNQSVKARVSIFGDNYDYTRLPDGTKTTQKEFEYNIEVNGKYDFVVVDKNDEKIVKTLNVTNIDKTVPEGSCVATLYNDKTSVSVTMTSFNYIAGYNYYVDNKSSGFIEYSFYNSTQKDAKEVYVIAKDFIGNEGKIVCTKSDQQSHFDPQGIHTVIREKPRLRIPIDTALAQKGYKVKDLNKCIYDRVVEAGPHTRYGVAAAAFGLIDCTYKMTGLVLSYDHEGGKVEGSYCTANSSICGKLGINTRWGKRGGACKKDECWYGLNCATFVRWAMCNGGMNLCKKGSADAFPMASKTYFPEADGVEIRGSSVNYYSGTNLTKYGALKLLQMLKPGDVIGSDEGGGHTFVVVGYDTQGIYTAEDGYYMRHIYYSEMLNGKHWYRLLFLDKYYENTKNHNSLYD